MIEPVPQSHGGRAAAIVLRAGAIRKYYENPNICKYCKEVIHVGEGKKVSWARKKTFCSRSCLSKSTNSRWIGVPKKPKVLKPRVRTLKVGYKPFEYLIGKTKADIFKTRKGYQSARSGIQRHARHVYALSSRPKQCAVCAYARHYEVCHLKSVSEFDGAALIIEEVNHIDNLIAMCPTHHWEFDHGFIDKEKLLSGRKK